MQKMEKAQKTDVKAARVLKQAKHACTTHAAATSSSSLLRSRWPTVGFQIRERQQLPAAAASVENLKTPQLLLNRLRFKPIRNLKLLNNARTEGEYGSTDRWIRPQASGYLLSCAGRGVMSIAPVSQTGQRPLQRGDRAREALGQGGGDNRTALPHVKHNFSKILRWFHRAKFQDQIR